jgi:hypothetical protein
LRAEHLDDARLYADREHLVRSLHPYRGGRLAELGVAVGDFSRFLIDELMPKRFDAFDLFQLHHKEKLWGRASSEYFQGGNHIDYYERMFAREIEHGIVHVFEGDSSTQLSLQEDQSYDVIYIDADHTLEGVTRDATVAAQKLKADGLLIFNDYILHRDGKDSFYGIVPLVNDWCVNRGWKVTHFALQPGMWCDIAISRQVRKPWYRRTRQWLSRA